MDQRTVAIKPGKRTTAAGNGVSNETGARQRPAGTLGSAEARSRQVLAAMIAFRDGEFSQRLPAHWTGIDGEIAAAFNQTIAQEARIAAEVARLSATVGKEGRLRQRMTLPGSLGGWATKVESINTLMDDLVRPTAEIARTIGAVAKGDLGQAMELEVDGLVFRGRLHALDDVRDDLLDLGLRRLRRGLSESGARLCQVGTALEPGDLQVHLAVRRAHELGRVGSVGVDRDGHRRGGFLAGLRRESLDRPADRRGDQPRGSETTARRHLGSEVHRRGPHRP